MRLKADSLLVGRLVTPAGHRGHRNVADSGWESLGGTGGWNQPNYLIHLDFTGSTSCYLYDLE